MVELLENSCTEDFQKKKKEKKILENTSDGVPFL